MTKYHDNFDKIQFNNLKIKKIKSILLDMILKMMTTSGFSLGIIEREQKRKRSEVSS